MWGAGVEEEETVVVRNGGRDGAFKVVLGLPPLAHHLGRPHLTPRHCCCGEVLHHQSPAAIRILRVGCHPAIPNKRTSG